MAKSMCDSLIYSILANDDPKEYPLAKDGPMKYPISTYSSNSGACTYEATMTACYNDECTESKLSMTQQDCDCSDPKNYNFEDEGRFMILKVK